jgi:hypothetical protein
MKSVIGLLMLLFGFGAIAGEVNYQRAHHNYQMFCQGCHTPDGTGARSIPRMKDHIGYFLQTPKGRAYLVRVPGSAMSALDSEQLAELLNWIILEFSGPSSDGDFQYYTRQEVAELRRSPLVEVDNYRNQILMEIAVNGNRR